ncbi:hypothetical protein AB0M44_42710 [Streptosporangium subroseum]|uniref:hypothetical protein n=1 Tax=Streptosporangium subroseum TaxID=106412 RepID=UPI0034259327
MNEPVADEVANPAMDGELIDYEAIRKRFPWVGIMDSGEHDLSSRYREIMANLGRNW